MMFSLSRVVKRFTSSNQTKNRKRERSLRVEPLENRELLAVDIITWASGGGTLEEPKNFHNPDNWSPETVPDQVAIEEKYHAIISPTTSTVIEFNPIDNGIPPRVVSELLTVSDGDVTLVIPSDASYDIAAKDGATIGKGAGVNADVTVLGSLNIEGGAIATDDVTADGTLKLDGILASLGIGNTTLSEPGETLVVGKDGTGTLEAVAGAKILAKDGNLVIGQEANSVGTLSLTGIGTDAKVLSIVNAGAGRGFIDIQDHAKLETLGEVSTAQTTEALASVLVDNATWTAKGDTDFSGSGDSILIVRNGGLIDGPGKLTLAESTQVFDTGSKIATEGSIIIASGSTSITAGADASSMFTELIGGLNGSMQLTVSGTGSSFTSDSFIDHGFGTTSILVEQNAEFTTTGDMFIGGQKIIGHGIDAMTSLQVKTGGSVVAVGELSIGSRVNTEFIVDGGTVISNEGVTGETSFSSDIQVTVQGEGSSWTIFGTLENAKNAAAVINVIDGGTISAGTQIINQAQGIVNVNAGSSIITPKLLNHGIASPGLSAGIFVLDGDFEQFGTGVLEIELGGLTAGALYDQLQITNGIDAVGGNAMLGGTLDVAFIDGFEDTVTFDDTFTVLTATGNINGKFNKIDYSDAQLPSQWAWQAEYYPTGVVLRVVDAPTAISALSDAIVRTDGTLFEAVNLGETETRTVNGVSFAGSLTRDDFDDKHSGSDVYVDGNVSGAFEAMLDSFSFTAGNVGNPGGGNLTLTGLTAGTEYLLQLFVSDDRTSITQTKTQTYALGSNQSEDFANGLSYSFVNTFVATGSTEVIDVEAWPGIGQSETSAIINAFQVRDLTPPGANELFVQSVVAISSIGDSVVETQGTRIEAVNLGQSNDRTVNTVVFDGSLSRDDFVSDYSNANVYTDGNVSNAFEKMLDSLSFTSGNVGNPGGGDLTLTGLTAGNDYLVQLFVSDDRHQGVRTRTQNYTSGGTETDAYQNGGSYSLVGTFTAIGSTQDIEVKAWPGVGQTASSAIINAFQVRDVTAGASQAMAGGGSALNAEVAQAVVLFESGDETVEPAEVATAALQAAATPLPVLVDLAFDDEAIASLAFEVEVPSELPGVDAAFASFGDEWSMLDEQLGELALNA